MPDVPPPSSHRPDADQGHVEPERDGAPAASEPDGAARVAEAGNAYVGRGLDDALKSSDRLTEPGEGLQDNDPDPDA